MAEPMKTVSILEPCPGGHRLFYVSRIVAGATSRGIKCTLYTSETALDSQEFRVHLGKYDPDDLAIKLISPRAPATLMERFRLLNRVLSDSADPLLLPEGDPLLLPLCLSKPQIHRAVSLLLLRTQHGEGFKSQLSYLMKALLASLLMATGKVRLLRLVAPLSRGLTQPPYGFGAIEEFEDPLPSPSAAPSEEFLAGVRSQKRAGATLALIAGTFDERKSPGQILDWLSRTTMNPRPVLVIAGQVRQPIKNLIQNFERDTGFSQNIAALDRYLSDEELQACFQAADVVFVLYSNIGSSGILGHALLNRKPIIAWGNPDVVKVVDHYGIGRVIHDRSQRSIDQALSSLRCFGWPESVSARMEKQQDVAYFIDAMLSMTK